MLSLVKKLLSPAAGPAGEPDERSRHKRALVATCAILLEMAYIDGTFTEQERERIISIMENGYGLGRTEIDAVMESAEAEREKSIDLWQFTSLINRYYSEEEKNNIIEMVWKVVFADGRLDKYEDYLVHNLSNLLRLDHAQLIEAKLRARGG